MNSKSMAGWIGFAAIVLLIVGAIDFFQGLIAVFEDEYFVPTGSGFLVFDLTAWGWTMMIWGVLLVLAGLGLGAGQGWARWFAIVVVSLNFIAQLGFLGNTQNTALVTDGDSPEHHRALRADRALEREPGRGHHRPLDAALLDRGRRAAWCAAASRAHRGTSPDSSSREMIWARPPGLLITEPMRISPSASATAATERSLIGSTRGSRRRLRRR